MKTSARTLAEALVGADVFFGLSVKGAVTKDMVKSMAAKPIIFAMANPDPEITAEEVAEVRDDAIMATGRSDYPNQVNNVLGFPYIFRGALDVRATTINMEMKIAAARALAELAREDVPDEVAAAYGARPKFGPDYIIPVPFDPRLISYVPPAVAAGRHGHRRRAQADRRHGGLPGHQLRSRRDPVAGVLQRVFERLRRSPQARRVRRRRGGAGDPRRGELRARGARHRAPGRARGPRSARARRRSASSSAAASRSSMRRCRSATPATPTISTSACSAKATCSATASAWSTRTATTSRPAWWRSTTPTPWSPASPATSRSRCEDVRRVIDPKPGHRVIGLSLVLARGRTVLVADTAVTEMPKAEELADIAVEAAGVARRIGYEPRLALLAFSTFGHPPGERSAHVHRGGEDPRPAARRLRIRRRDGGRRRAQPGAAARPIRSAGCPGPANVLIMPAFHSASISTKLLQELGGATVIGPLLVGLDRPVQIVPLGANDCAARQHGGAGGVQRRAAERSRTGRRRNA